MRHREICELLAAPEESPWLVNFKANCKYLSQGLTHVADGPDDTRFLDSVSREIAFQKILPELNKSTEHISGPLKLLQLNGYLRLRGHVGCDVIENIKQYIFSNPLYAGHVKAHGDQSPVEVGNEEALSHLPSGYYTSDISDALGCPDILRIASDPLLLHLVSDYLGFFPSIYSINVMWNVSQEGLAHHPVQRFHRDWDDFKTCCLFVYLTDVGPSMGPHIYQVGSHLLCDEEEANECYRLQDDPSDMIADYHQETLVGSQGDAFITDPYGLHKGGPLTEKGFRGVVWIRYGMYDNYMCREVDGNIKGSDLDAAFMEKIGNLHDDHYRHLWRLFL
jgi:hypothetical protein